MACPACRDLGWVCEDHPTEPWEGLLDPDEVRCCGGAGAPCTLCRRGRAIAAAPPPPEAAP